MKQLLFVLLLAPAIAGAQSYTYPSFQLPTIVEREYNFAAADAIRAGTTLLVQWREQVATRWQLGVDAGLADPEGNASTRLVLGGHAAFQLTRETADFPFDVALTSGVGFSAAAGRNVVRVPLGASVGKRLEFDSGPPVTMFAHPRLSLDRCNDCVAGGSAGKLNLSADFGVNVQLSAQVGLRVITTMSGGDYFGSGNDLGLSVAWTPKGLRK